MSPQTWDEWEYDPEYQAAYQQTVDYQTRRLSYAIGDTGNEIARGLLPMLLSMSSEVRAIWSEFHANEVAAMGWLRREWHFLTGHRR